MAAETRASLLSVGLSPGQRTRAPSPVQDAELNAAASANPAIRPSRARGDLPDQVPLPNRQSRGCRTWLRDYRRLLTSAVRAPRRADAASASQPAARPRSHDITPFIRAVPFTRETIASRYRPHHFPIQTREIYRAHPRLDPSGAGPSILAAPHILGAKLDSLARLLRVLSLKASTPRGAAPADRRLHAPNRTSPIRQSCTGHRHPCPSRLRQQGVLAVLYRSSADRSAALFNRAPLARHPP